MNWTAIFEIADLATAIARGFVDKDKEPEADKVLRLVGLATELGRELQLDNQQVKAVLEANDGEIPIAERRRLHRQIEDKLDTYFQ